MQYYAAHTPHIITDQDAFNWIVDMKNDVNQRLGQKQLSYDEADKALQERTRRNYLALTTSTGG